MQTEIEAKFLNIDHDSIRKSLKGLGAECVKPNRLMRRKNLDFENSQLAKFSGWVRVRDEGDKVTLSYKQLNDRTLHGTKEVSVVVDDFEKTCTFLEAIGLVTKTYQETKRESWMLNGCEIELDEWPWAPTYLEIESKDEESLRSTVQALGLNWTDALHGSVEVVYQDVYDVTEDEVNSWPEILFTQVPEWLEQKRIK